MKKIPVLILIITMSFSGFCQQISPGAATQPDYLRRAKRQQTIATIILVSAPVLIIAPVVIGSSINKGGDATEGIIYGTIAAGFLCLPVSIGLFIVSSVNNKKGVRLGLKNESMNQLRNNGFAKTRIPSLSLKFNF